MPIARVNSADLGLQFSGSYSAAYSCGAGADRLLVAGIFAGTTDDVSNVQYNGVGMSQIVKVQCPLDRFAYLYYLLAPGSGSHNLTFSAGGGVGYANVADYTGVLGLDASGSNTASNVSSCAASLTVVAANSWVVAFTKTSDVTTPGWTNATALQNASGAYFADSNAPVAAGSDTVTLALNVGDYFGLLVASFSPVVAAAGNPWYARAQQ